jgi:5-deoxy-glucuronate isomerase
MLPLASRAQSGAHRPVTRIEEERLTKAHRLVAPEMPGGTDRQTDLISLSVADPMIAGETLELGSADETAVVVLAGTVEVAAGSRQLGRVGWRRDVFEAPGEAIYAPPGVTLRLTAAEGPASLAVVSTPVDGASAPAEARIITPADQRIADVGEDNWQRTVRTILGPEHAAGRLLLGETINPPGNWSSYPPHKHDTHEPPREARLEEVYLFKVDPPGGFGVQLRYGPDGESARRVRDGDAVAIRSGYHPVVAAAGYRLYYLWAMAGQGRQMIPYLDPAYAWVQQGRQPPGR